MSLHKNELVNTLQFTSVQDDIYVLSVFEKNETKRKSEPKTIANHIETASVCLFSLLLLILSLLLTRVSRYPNTCNKRNNTIIKIAKLQIVNVFPLSKSII